MNDTTADSSPAGDPWTTQGTVDVLGEPDTWFRGAQRVLFVHAHPDDETLSTGGTLAGLSAAGRNPAVLTLTRGERGEVVAGPLAALEGTPALAEHREGELRAALEALGVAQHAFLGTAPALRDFAEPRAYRDSGMVWQEDGWAGPAPDAGSDALTLSPAHDAIADAIEYVVAAEATCIVSYDDRGGYGHPDHVFAHRLARAVAYGLDLPFWEIVPDTSVVPEGSDVVAHDVSLWLDQKRAALGEHATQLTVTGADELVHSGGQAQQIARTESFLRVGR